MPFVSHRLLFVFQESEPDERLADRGFFFRAHLLDAALSCILAIRYEPVFLLGLRYAVAVDEADF